MKVNPVKSSAFSHEGYDPATKTLEIHFHSGAVHRYHDVEPYDYARFKAAPSKGAHFAQHFRSRPNIQVKAAKPKGKS